MEYSPPVYKNSHLPHKKERSEYIMPPTQNTMRVANHLNQSICSAISTDIPPLISSFLALPLKPSPTKVNMITFPRDLSVCMLGHEQKKCWYHKHTQISQVRSKGKVRSRGNEKHTVIQLDSWIFANTTQLLIVWENAKM